MPIQRQIDNTSTARWTLVQFLWKRNNYKRSKTDMKEAIRDDRSEKRSDHLEIDDDHHCREDQSACLHVRGEDSSAANIEVLQQIERQDRDKGRLDKGVEDPVPDRHELLRQTQI